MMMMDEIFNFWTNQSEINPTTYRRTMETLSALSTDWREILPNSWKDTTKRLAQTAATNIMSLVSDHRNATTTSKILNSLGVRGASDCRDCPHLDREFLYAIFEREEVPFEGEKWVEVFVKALIVDAYNAYDPEVYESSYVDELLEWSRDWVESHLNDPESSYYTPSLFHTDSEWFDREPSDEGHYPSNLYIHDAIETSRQIVEELE